MLLECLYDTDLAQASYFIGCQARGEAIVIDARRDIQAYLDLAAQHGIRIVAVTETHSHADYLSGSRELAAATGATLYVSGEGGPDWQYAFDGSLLRDGDAVHLGNLTLTARHTPGHTPEHLAFLVTDGAFSDTPGYLISGDFVFAGDIGRPDLLDEAAGGVDTRFGGARALFASLRDVFLALPDHVRVFPGHGSGSACGKALGALPSTTVGYEKLNAWWAPYLRNGDEEGFVAHLLADQPDAHAYFARMKRENREGPRVLGTLPALTEYASADLARPHAEGTLALVETAPLPTLRDSMIERALYIPATGKTATHGAWAYNPDADDTPLVLHTDSEATAATMRAALLRVGIDNVVGYCTEAESQPTAPVAYLDPADVDRTDAAALLDVRNATEYRAGHIPGARHVSASRIVWQLDALPREGTLNTYCQGGARNAVASAALRRAGFTVLEVDGSYAAWQSLAAVAASTH
ncbi:MBL fold metallo-hydrolase [Micrococcales bacterium 31B]|nr:MBL fold metallo-hydrolase [Micrococcales bacterium 31B]